MTYNGCIDTHLLSILGLDKDPFLKDGLHMISDRVQPVAPLSVQAVVEDQEVSIRVLIKLEHFRSHENRIQPVNVRERPVLGWEGEWNRK